MLTPGDLRGQLERARENLLDCDIAVDGCRRALDGAVVGLHQAMQARDRAIAHLAHLLVASQESRRD